MIHKHITITKEQDKFIEDGDLKLSQIVQKRLNIMMEGDKNEHPVHGDCNITYSDGS